MGGYTLRLRDGVQYVNGKPLEDLTDDERADFVRALAAAYPYGQGRRRERDRVAAVDALASLEDVWSSEARDTERPSVER